MSVFSGPTLTWNQQEIQEDAGFFASGGTVTEITQNDVVYRVHTFTTVGVSTLTTNRQLKNVEYLIIAGGGAGGGGFVGGGGGAGGLVTNIFSNKISISQNSYNIIVGSGGTVSGATPFNGENSSIDIVGITTAIGGGKGAVSDSVPPSTGGSGGGGRFGNGGTASTNVLGADGISGQGNKGGNGVISYDQRNWFTGAGGGAGGVGQNGTWNGELYATGGSGLSFNIDGTSKTYSTGGRGSLRKLAHTSTKQGLSGSPNTGNGGGGSHDNLSGGTGGSGIIIIRYPIGVVGQ